MKENSCGCCGVALRAPWAVCEDCEEAFEEYWGEPVDQAHPMSLKSDLESVDRRADRD